ncbi:unnamed protein product [Bemisia tabaci]|uniref:Uncharacterized protein n=1 Tax=Bemisia tabaci TaxID=7038 RepID=A0A9P0F6A7_BEMTA|nr:unnamed protein product [Bemisia tabaci]
MILLRYGCLLALLINVGCVPLFNLNTWERELDVNVCTTSQCQQSAALLVRSLNQSADPCEDFYQFACGGWVASHEVPKTRSHWNQFNVVDDKLNSQLKKILETDDPMDPEPVRSAHRMYEACMDTERIEAAGLNPLIKLLDEFGGWPMAMTDWDPTDFDWLKITLESIRRWSTMSLFYFYVYVDRKNSNQSVITVDQASVVLPRSMLVEPALYRTQIEAYKQWIAANALLMSRHTKQNVSVESAVIAADEVVALEMELAALTTPSEMRRNAFRMYQPMTLRTLQMWTDTASDTFRVDWARVVAHLFAETGLTFDLGERLIVREMDFLFHLFKLLERTPTRVLANYLHWRLVKTVSRDLNSEVSNLAFEFERVFTGAELDVPRWQDCVETVTSLMGFAVGYKYVKLHFDNEAKRTALQMVGIMEAAFLSQVDALTWMDEETRTATREKLLATTYFIGYPHWYHNESALVAFYQEVEVSRNHLENVELLKTVQFRQMVRNLRRPIDRLEWLTSPAIVNAYNNLQMNSVIFPAGILQPPFFQMDRTQALNYGSIGVVIGHEIMHGFDDMGRLNDKYGNLAQWWSEATIQTYLQKAQCFVDQYNSYRCPNWMMCFTQRRR